MLAFEAPGDEVLDEAIVCRRKVKLEPNRMYERAECKGSCLETVTRKMAMRVEFF